MATAETSSFHFNLEPDGQSITAVRFYYGNVSSNNHDDVALQLLSLSSATQPRREFSFERVAGRDLEGDRASAASDYGLILNGDVTGDYPDNSDLFAYTLTPQSLTISGSQISSFSNSGQVSIEAGLHEINDADGSVELRLDWLNGEGTWSPLGTIATTDFKEDNPDWQLISDTTKVAPPDTTAPTILDSNDDPLATDGNGVLTLNQPENSTSVDDFNASEAVDWTLSGEDAALFTIDADGKLSFRAAPDFEDPKDTGNDNTYKLTLVATDAAGNSSNQPLIIKVGDEDEGAPPDTTAPTIWDSNDDPLVTDDNGVLTLNQPENSTSVDDFNASEAVDWTLSGEDAALFTIDADGKLSFRAAPDFEDPKDQGTDNTYKLTLVATDAAGNSSDQDLIIKVGDEDEGAPPDTTAPTIWDSNDDPLATDGNGVLTLNQPENSTSVDDFNASEAVDWTLSGEDAALFTIDADGKLSFKAAPDFEDPKDKGQDNTYIVNIHAEDLSGNQSSQPVAITIENVDENPPNSPPVSVAPELVINPEGNGLFFDPGSETSDALDQWVEIDLAMTSGLTGDDWVGVKVIAADGSLRDLGGVGHLHADDNQMLFSKPLLVQLKPNESLQLTRLNPPEIGGETTETVEFSSLDVDNFRAVVGGDLALNIKTSDREPTTWEEETVSIQSDTADGIFDFRQPDGTAPLALQVKILGDCADINQVGVVRLDTDATTGDILGSVNGVLSTAGADFRAAVKANMQGFDGVLPSVGGGVYEQNLNWSLDAAEQDAYALVMVSQTGEVYTFGTSTSADGKQHIKELGQNTFGFEDRAAGQGSDWDFNDVMVEIRTA